MYHTLLSAGKFAVYMAETDVYHRIAPAFGDLGQLSTRRKLIDAWLGSDYFSRSGLGREPLRSQVLQECLDPGNFLRTMMESVARHQGVDRWADNTPLHALYIPEIKRAIPDAKFIHMIRDGRDVAYSLSQLGWATPLPWDRRQSLIVSAMYWDWIVRKCRCDAGVLASGDYVEIHFEDLVMRPRETLRQLSSFIGEDLNYDYVINHPVGVLEKPNSAFGSNRGPFKPLGRWKGLTSQDVSALTAVLDSLLRDLRYSVNTPSKPGSISRRLRLCYPRYFQLRQVLRRSFLSPLLVKGLLQSGALDKEDSRWEVIRTSACPPKQHNGAGIKQNLL